jgi:predicted DNA-binding antitoxin AbrB/MazE fold protein
MTIRYCTKEWLEESARLYKETDHFENALKKVTAKLFYRITADSNWGIEKDIIFGAEVKEGKLLEMGFYSEAEARKRAEFILGATPQVWKGILRKDKKFISEFMMGKVKLEEGSKVELLKITPYANHFVDALTQFEIQFPDEMSADELEAYRADVSEFRERADV